MRSRAVPLENNLTLGGLSKPWGKTRLDSASESMVGFYPMAFLPQTIQIGVPKVESHPGYEATISVEIPVTASVPGVCIKRNAASIPTS